MRPKSPIRHRRVAFSPIIALIALIALFAIPRTEASSIQDLPCDFTCPATVSSTSIGTVPAGVWTVIPVGTINGSGQVVVDVDSGAVDCTTCDDCTTGLQFSFHVLGKCVAYNECGLLAQGPHGGVVVARLTSCCGVNSPQAHNQLRLSAGTCNPAYGTGACPPDTPVIAPPDFFQLWWLNCGSCQDV